MIKKMLIASTIAFSSLGAMNAYAGGVAITSYDITNAEASGFGGGWSYKYDGTISPTGTVSSLGNPLYNLTNGSGTLNDGKLSGSDKNNQLFWLADKSSITLNLASSTKISDISIFGGDNTNSAVTGTLTGWDVTINGITQSFNSTGFGALGYFSKVPMNDLVSLAGSSLSNLVTRQITLSNFTGGFAGSYVNIGEIQVNGGLPPSTNAVPVPGAVWLFASGLMGLIGYSRRKQVQA